MFRASNLTVFFLSIFCFNVMAAERPRVVQGIRVPVASLDPFATTGIDAFSAMSNVIEPLFRIHPSTGELMPCLGLSYKLDSNKKTIRVKLRPHVHFQNGDPLTSEDVQFTFEAYYKPEYGGAIWQGMWSEVEGAKTIDPETVEFKLKEWRYPYFVSVLTSLRVLPRSAYGQVDKKKFQSEIVGTGAFKLKRFEPNRKLDLEPNDEWWGSPKPKFDLTIKAIDDATLAAQMVQKGEMDFYLLEAGQGKPAVTPTRFKSGLGRGFWIDLNFRKKLFESKNVRKALLLLWNREDLNRKVFKGEMMLALDVFTPNSEATPRGQPVRMDIKEARRLLTQEGWKDSDHDGVLDKNREKFSFTILVANSAEERWVSLYQQNARKVGVKVEIERIGEDAQWIERLKSGNFDAFASDGALIDRPEKYSWASDGIYNYSKYKNAEVDRLTEEVDLEFNPEKRRLKTRKLIEIIRADVPQIPGLVTRYESILLSKRLHPNLENPTRAWLWKLH
jgi:ABC-type transport system substrate-binding protein